MKKWTEMTARERDALVAEKVMGHQPVWSLDHPDGGLVMRPSGKPFLDMTKVPYFTSNIRAAWLVVEKLDKEGIRLNMSRFYAGRVTDVDCWGVDFDTKDGAEYCGTYGDTAPEAICKAALMVVGVSL